MRKIQLKETISRHRQILPLFSSSVLKPTENNLKHSVALVVPPVASSICLQYLFSQRMLGRIGYLFLVVVVFWFLYSQRDEPQSHLFTEVNGQKVVELHAVQLCSLMNMFFFGASVIRSFEPITTNVIHTHQSSPTKFRWVMGNTPRNTGIRLVYAWEIL